MMKAEIKNIDLEIEQMEYMGCAGVSYSEKSAPTNQFSSVVENEVVIREKRIGSLEDSKRDKVIIVSKIDNALEILDPRELQLICYRYLDIHKLNNREIAVKVDLTEQWVCTLNTEIVTRLSKLINL